MNQRGESCCLRLHAECRFLRIGVFSTVSSRPFVDCVEWLEQLHSCRVEASDCVEWMMNWKENKEERKKSNLYPPVVSGATSCIEVL